MGSATEHHSRCVLAWAGAVALATVALFAARYAPGGVSAQLTVWAAATAVYVFALLRLRSALVRWVSARLERRIQQRLPQQKR